MIRVLIVSDVRLYRDALAETLARHDGLSIVGAAPSTDDAIRLAAALSPEVLLIDHALPDSLRAIRLIGTVQPGIRLVMLGMLESDKGVLACAEAGVAGYVPRDASLHDLLGIIESAARGELRCPPQIAATLLRQIAQRAAGPGDLPPRAPLTSREAEIVRLIEQGLSNKEIAVRLGIQVATVKNHVHNLLEKLRVRHRADAAARLRGRDPRRPTPAGLRAVRD
jgi:DNA-binding NarL/FixJ family response regulator